MSWAERESDRIEAAGEEVEALREANAHLTAKLGEVKRERDLARERLDGDAWERLTAERDKAVSERDAARLEVGRLDGERVQLEQLCRDNNWLGRDQVLEVLNGEGMAAWREANDALAWSLGQLQTLRGLCDAIERMDGYDLVNASVTVRAIREIIDMESPYPPLTSIAELGDDDGTPGPCQPIGCDNGYHLSGCVFAEVDADLPDRDVLAKLKAWREAKAAFEATRMDPEHDALWAATDELVEAVDALGSNSEQDARTDAAEVIGRVVEALDEKRVVERDVLTKAKAWNAVERDVSTEFLDQHERDLIAAVDALTAVEATPQRPRQSNEMRKAEEDLILDLIERRDETSERNRLTPRMEARRIINVLDQNRAPVEATGTADETAAKS